MAWFMIIKTFRRHQSDNHGSVMITSTNGNIFGVTGPLYEEFTGERRIPRTPALKFSLICTWIYGWVNNCEAGDLRRHGAPYDVTVMLLTPIVTIVSVKRYQLQTKYIHKGMGRMTNHLWVSHISPQAILLSLSKFAFVWPLPTIHFYVYLIGAE